MRAAAAARQLHPGVDIRLIGVDPSMEKVPPVSPPSFFFCVSLSLSLAAFLPLYLPVYLFPISRKKTPSIMHARTRAHTHVR